MKRLIQIIAILPVALVLTACPNKKSGSAASKVRQKIFVKGDPKSIYEGATLNTKSPITTDNVESLNNYQLSSLFDFVEQTTKIKTGDDLEAENETKDAGADVSERTNEIRVDKNQDGEWEMILFGGKARMTFKQMSDRSLQPYKISDDGMGADVPIRVLHWSERDPYISLLISGETSVSGRFLSAIYIEKMAMDKAIPTTDKRFVYSAGPGRKLGWKIGSDEVLEISLCSGKKIWVTNVEEKVNLWKKVLEGRLNIDFKHRLKYPPFTDLNYRCIYTVDAYLTDNRATKANYASTYTSYSTQQMSFFDSDIFLFKSEFEKLIGSMKTAGLTEEQMAAELKPKMDYTILHEIGHMLGLGHKFKGEASVMSYKYEDMEPTQYDIEALHALYPEY